MAGRPESPGRGIYYPKVKNEKKFKKMEEKRPNEMEMAAQKNEEREEKTSQEITVNFCVSSL